MFHKDSDTKYYETYLLKSIVDAWAVVGEKEIHESQQKFVQKIRDEICVQISQK